MVMIKNRNIVTAALLTATVVTSMNALAAETVTSTATVTVQNAFTFAETSPINFGTIRAKAVAAGDATNGSDTGVAAGADVAVMTLSSLDDSTSITAGTTATLQVLTPGLAGVYTVSGLIANSSLTLTLPTATSTSGIKLSKAVPDTNGAYFWMYGFEATVTSGTAAGSTYAAGNLTADGSGNASFTLGATLATSHPTSTATQLAYTDEAYTGDYTMTIEY